MEGLHLRAKDKKSMISKLYHILKLQFSFLIIYFFINSNISGDEIFKIQSLDISNELISSIAGDWQVTNTKIDPENYYENWKIGKEEIKWQSYKVPGNLSAIFPVPFPKGFRVFVKKEFIIPESWSTAQISLFFRRISDRDKTYLNGQLIGSTGNFDSSDPEAIFISRIYDIPTNILKKGQKNLLLIEIQTYFHNLGGILLNNVSIGPSMDIYSNYQNRESLKVFIALIYFLIGLIFLFIYMNRLKSIEFLYYSIFNIIFAVYQVSLSQLIYDYTDNKIIIWHIPYLFIPFIFLIFTQFIIQYFKYTYLSVQKLLDSAVVLLFLYLLLKWDLKADILVWRNFHIPICFLYLLLILNILIKMTVSKIKEAKYMLMAFILLLPSVIIDLLLNFDILSIPQIISPMFILLFDVSFAIILSIHIEKIRRDITDINQNLEKKVLQRTNEIRESLNQLQKLKVREDNIHYIIGINLKNSVDQIKELSEMLLRFEFIESEERENVLNKIFIEGHELYLSLENLIAWTKIQKGITNLNFSNFTLAEIFQKELHSLLDIAKRRGIEVVYELDDKSINSDREKVVFIIRKLFSNALEFSNKGTIHVSSNVSNNNFYYCVTDSGSGIEENKIEKLISEKDFQSQESGEIKSTSIGMKICNQYLDLLKGKIEIKSEIGKGTEVYIIIPAT